MPTRTMTCQHCGSSFTRTNSPANLNRQKYCGRKCAGIATTSPPPLLESLAIRLAARSAPQPNGCIIYTGQSNGSYGQIEYKRRTYLAHRAAYMVHKGEIPPGKCVCHQCDVRLCINPDHLWLGTYSGNVRDMLAKGRSNYNPRRKLTAEQVAGIRSDTASHAEIAARYGVSTSLVSMTKSGQRNAGV